jgi:D-glycero-alpha-D-manno-heptose-7-phosphate kinase
VRIINAAAPLRVCDNGGWTDTWFARRGRIFNIAVRPPAEVQLEVRPVRDGEPRVFIHAENYGDRYAPSLGGSGWDRHPLLEAAVAFMNVPEDLALRLTIFCSVPAGASTGTSAAVAVAMVGALDALTPGRLTPQQIASAAHTIEVDLLEQQSGVQDQLCSAFGGVNFIEMSRYPDSHVWPLDLPDAMSWELERRLALVYLGRSHSSSQVHEKVIAHLTDRGPDCAELEALRNAAERSRDAVMAGDFDELGRAMRDNTEAQRRLHPDLVSADADRVIEIARAHGAAGWKVNGAGGEGGSLTLLGNASSSARRAMIREMEQASDCYRQIPISLSREGLRVWESSAQA